MGNGMMAGRRAACVSALGLALLAAAPAAFAQTPAAPQPIPIPVPAPQQRPAAQAPAAPAPATQAPATSPQTIDQVLRDTRPVGRVAPGGVLANPQGTSTKTGATIAFTAEQRALIDRISGYLSHAQSLAGDFVQIGPDGRRTQGRFYLQRPGKVRFEYDPPSPIDVVADGESLAVRDRKLATQDLYPLSQTPLRFLLADRIDLLKDTSVIGVQADDVFATVVIEERNHIVGTNRLMIMFASDSLELRQWTVTDAQGFETTVAVYNLATDMALDQSLFKIDYTRYVQ